MHSSLRSSSAWLFVINTRLGNSSEIISALIDSGATKTFLSNRLALPHQDIAKPLELQLFNGHPAPSGPITKSHSSTLILDNGLRFPVDFLVTQLHESTPIVLGLPWLRNVNPDIDWATLTMKFDTPGAELAAAIHLLPSPNLDDTEPRDTLNTPEPQSPTLLPAHAPCPPNISRNKYKGPNYPTQSSWSTLRPTLEDVPPPLAHPSALDIKIIGAAPFARILQEGAQAFQLHITPALPEEHLRAEASPPEPKTEEETLRQVIPPEYHEFADVFSMPSAADQLDSY
ncbi:hypothetical protein C0992_008521 [Termitomyces sp. T32_za158]|nr:hypothetical protein C0992_008521 [Termitomyces sp. T32_za158]